MKIDRRKTAAGDLRPAVQNEVDIEKLTGELLSLVNEAIQPASVSLWLKDG